MENTVQQTQNADPISTLPTNQTQPSYNELKIVDTLFKEHRGSMNKIVEEGKESVIVGILFVIFSLVPVDELIKRLLPITQNSSYILILFKVLLVIVFYWVIKNFWLSRN